MPAENSAAGVQFFRGLHGVGASVVNALSEWMEVTVCREYRQYNIRFERGLTVRPLTEVGPCEATGDNHKL